MEFPGELRYTREHEWVRVESDGRARVGITDYAQDQLGDLVYVELPQAGSEVRAGESLGEVESTKSVSDVYSPVTGKIAAHNAALDQHPELVNGDPYGEGWMVLVVMSDPSEVNGLLDAEGYREFVEKADPG